MTTEEALVVAVGLIKKGQEERELLLAEKAVLKEQLWLCSEKLKSVLGRLEEHKDEIGLKKKQLDRIKVLFADL